MGVQPDSGNYNINNIVNNIIKYLSIFDFYKADNITNSVELKVLFPLSCLSYLPARKYTEYVCKA